MTAEIVYPWGKLPPIRIYNSMTRREEEFPSAEEHPEVSIYVCGPTTYSFVHIGNMRGPVFFDVVRNVFRAHGYRVKFVTNFTDIDDKMIEEARRVGEEDPIQLSARFVHEYYTDLFALGVQPADIYPKVSCHIPEIIAYIELIMKNGHGYIGGDGSVYFDVPSFPEYLKLSGRHMDDLIDESRQDEKAEAKRDPRDFALWKAAKVGEPYWDSPWGPGRPGWHIECSVMSAFYLGASFDIHGGGQELKFPHHENEIAGAKCGYPDEEFARIWMHFEWVMFEGEKMAKSGKSLKIRDVLKEHDSEVIRLFLLSAHYRKPVDFTFGKLEELVKAKNYINFTFERLVGILRWRAEERGENWLRLFENFKDEFRKKENLDEFEGMLNDGAKVIDPNLHRGNPSILILKSVWVALHFAHHHLATDFNTQGAVGELFNLLSRLNLSLDWTETKTKQDFDAANIALGALVHLTEILGIMKAERESLYSTAESREEVSKEGGDAGKLAEVLLRIREMARESKNFELADRIRDELGEIGAEVRDSGDGPKIVWN